PPHCSSSVPPPDTANTSRRKPMPASTVVQGIAQVAFTVTDVPRAVAFYKDVVGLPQIPIPAPPTMAFFDAGGVRIMLSTNEGTVPGGGTFVYLKTPDIKGKHREMVARGVKFTG